ncbi:MAG: YdcF family protein [Chloroflexota bacterium]|nr:YdcF family protein [Chloroflexota bacterium]
MRRDLIRLVVVAIAGAVLLAAYTSYRIWAQGARDERRPAAAIVVLGAAQFDGRPSPVFKARLDHAIDLYRAGVAPLLVTTGGNVPGDWTTEAAVARAFAIEQGVPAGAIVFEDRGRNTVESLRAVAALLRGRGIADAVFVSDRSHMLRVLRIARDEGITGWGSPTDTSPTDADFGRRVDATIHELGALAFYFVARDVGPESPALAGANTRFRDAIGGR